VDEKETNKRGDRASRFREYNASIGTGAPKQKIKYSLFTNRDNDNDDDDTIDSFGDGAQYRSLKIVGTSENLEKTYLRLTQAPDPSTVRPERVLRASLAMLLTKWKDRPDYKYTCDNFKSMRQDLTVISSSFICHPYCHIM
jgi:hypothetical protein